MVKSSDGGYEPGDVVYFPGGPFYDVCGVVRDVDPIRDELVIHIADSRSSYSLRVAVGEVEYA
ncbi:hypothetical protein [Nocardia abscessus]|uniref:hypothetical protein n=1 Tax=Nocardia abscessus TaxID=120957 RepID=UPI002456B2B8|nr:hypothetical protein [Nocardia abscessus]